MLDKDLKEGNLEEKKPDWKIEQDSEFSGSPNLM
jgi:hypothetical protein